MKKHWLYLKYVVRHKWYTFKAAQALGITWLGTIHDWTKFLPSEWFAYVDNFYGGEFPTDKQADDEEKRAMRVAQCSYRPKSQGDVKRAFDCAWLHHQKSNRHHWQYWLLQYDKGDSWHLQEMSIENPKIIAENGVPLVWCEADERWNDDAIHAQAYKHCKRIIDSLNLSPVALPMPDRYRREMLADWRGAGMAINGKDETADWYKKNRDSIIIHPDTRDWIEKELMIG